MSDFANTFGMDKPFGGLAGGAAQMQNIEPVTVGSNLALTDKLLAELGEISSRLADAIDGPEPEQSMKEPSISATSLVGHTDIHNIALNRAISKLRRAINGLGLKQ